MFSYKKKGRKRERREERGEREEREEKHIQFPLHQFSISPFLLLLFLRCQVSFSQQPSLSHLFPTPSLLIFLLPRTPKSPFFAPNSQVSMFLLPSLHFFLLQVFCSKSRCFCSPSLHVFASLEFFFLSLILRPSSQYFFPPFFVFVFRVPFFGKKRRKRAHKSPEQKAKPQRVVTQRSLHRVQYFVLNLSRLQRICLPQPFNLYFSEIDSKTNKMFSLPQSNATIYRPKIYIHSPEKEFLFLSNRFIKL